MTDSITIGGNSNTTVADTATTSAVSVPLVSLNESKLPEKTVIQINSVSIDKNTNNNNNPSNNTTTKRSIRYKFSCPFVYSLLSISISQIVAATLIIYFLSYSAIHTTVNNIQSNNRLLILEHAASEINIRLLNTQQLVNGVEYRTIAKLPLFNQQNQLINTTGLFSDFAFFTQNVATLNAVGIANSGGLLIRGGIGPSGDQNQPRLYSICDSVTNFHCYYYSNSLINTTNNNTPNHPNLPHRNNALLTLKSIPNSIGSIIISGINSIQLQDFLPTDRIDILKPEYIETNYNITNNSFFQLAIDNPGTIQLTSNSLSGPLAGIEVITASKLIQFPITNNNNNNQLNYSSVAFVQLYLTFIDSMLNRLHYSQHTLILIIDISGKLIGTSRSNIKSNYKAAGYQSILQSNDEYLSPIGSVLLNNGYISPNPSTNTVSAFKSQFIRPAPILNQALSINKSGKHFTASLLTNPGLDWIIVVLTDDSEFDSSYNSTFQSMIIWTIMIIIISTIITVFAIRRLSGPLLKLVNLMSNISKASSNINQQQQQEQKLNTKLNQSKLDTSTVTTGPITELTVITTGSQCQSPFNGTGTGTGTGSRSITNNTINESIPNSPNYSISIKSDSNQLNNSIRSSRSTVIDRYKLVSELTKQWNQQSINTNCNLFGIELSVTEANLLSLTLSEMLTALSAMSSEMNEINLAKQQFIRYIFHEVRVPYNSIVLGIDQLQILMREIGLTSITPGSTPIQSNINTPLPFHSKHLIANIPNLIDASTENTPLSIIKRTIIPQQQQHQHQQQQSNRSPIINAVNNQLTIPINQSKQQQIQNDITTILDILHQQSKVVSMILNDVLSLQKIEEGALQLDYSPFCMHCLILRTLQSFQSEVEAKQLTVKLILPIINNSKSSTNTIIGTKSGINIESIQSITSAQAAAIPTDTNTGTVTDESNLINSNRTILLSSLSDFEQLQYELNHHSHLVLIGDRYRLRQVFSNYLSNAVKFTPELDGKIEIQLILFPIDNNNNNSINQLWNCKLLVIDNGPGMSSIESASLFKPFIQLSSGRAKGNKGTGLGLSICKSLIELHGGIVGVNSIIGSGSEFYFNLNLSQSINNSNQSNPNLNQNTNTNTSNPLQTPSINPINANTNSNSTSSSGAVSRDSDSININTNTNPTVIEDNNLVQIPVNSIDLINSNPNPNRNQNLIELAANTDANTATTAAIVINQQFDSLRISKINRFPIPSQSQSQSQSKPLKSYRILLIEDNLSSQKLLSMLLKSLNYSCTAVDNGYLGLLQLVEINPNHPNTETNGLNKYQIEQLTDQNIYRLIQPCPYDCILIDRQMPVLDGLESTKIMRSLGVEIPIIACTGAALDEDQAEFRLAGINDFLTKPIQKKRLISCLNNRLHSSSRSIHY